MQNSRGTFRVLPGNPDYLLANPDAQRTPFPDILKAYNGFEPGQGWTDLGPLMELRIENAYYQPGFSRNRLAGFLGTEVARYAVESNGLRLLSVQPMESRPAGETPVQKLISDRETRFSFYRLYFQIIFAHSDQSHGSALLGADSKQELDRLGAQMERPESVCHAGSTTCTVFSEACTVSVEIKIFVNGKPEMVSWGSELQRVIPGLRRVQMKRLYRGRLTPVSINSSDSNALKMPLLPGDRIRSR